jgi:YHS domain-containing protein
MKICNRKVLFLMLFIGIAAVLAACSNTDSALGINTDTSGTALRGFDAVSYFAAANAVRGDAKYEFAWNGAKWLFSSEENLKRFQADPEAFAPQFGGYCSYAVSEGYTADGDPEAWKIVDGKLYLNYNNQVKERWEMNQSERIENGRANWQAFRKKKPEHTG